MPRKARGPYLYWHRHDRTWIIRDGSRFKRTGTDEREVAELRLREWIAEKGDPRTGETGQHRLHAETVILYYLDIKLPEQKTRHRFNELTARCERLIAFFGGRPLATINGPSCRAYAAGSTTPSMARHDLEILRAAINLYDREFGMDHVPRVTLPPKGKPRDGHLTRSQAARLVMAAHRAGNRHLVRFLLISLYTGTRSGAVLDMQWQPNTSGGWFDFERGIMYRAPRGEGKSGNKRRPPAVIPNRLAAWLRRWRRQDEAGTGHGRARIRHVVHWKGEKVSNIARSFRTAKADADLPSWVIPHILRHTAITWAMQGGKRPATVSDFFGITLQELERTYWHHHPDYQDEMRRA